MKKAWFLGVGAIALLAVPLVASAVVLEGHFSGSAQHDGAAPGDYTGATQYDAYLTLNSNQVNPWYPWNAALEYTAHLSAPIQSYVGGVSQIVNFGVGTVEIFADDLGGGGTAADFANQSTFTDGTMILSGSVQNMAGQRLDVFGLPWGITGVIVFTGGPDLALVDAQCSGGLVMNDFIDFQIATPPAGYDEQYDAKWECPDTVGTDDETWGRIKALYQ
jgi:hypothetical protein